MYWKNVFIQLFHWNVHYSTSLRPKTLTSPFFEHQLCHHNNRVKVIFRFWSVVKLNESWKYILIVVIISSALLDTFCKRNLREGDSHIQRIRHVSHWVTVSRCLRYVIISKVNFAKQDLTTGKQRLKWFGRRQAAESSFKARWRLNQQTIGPNDAGDVATDSSLRWS